MLSILSTAICGVGATAPMDAYGPWSYDGSIAVYVPDLVLSIYVVLLLYQSSTMWSSLRLPFSLLYMPFSLYDS